MSAVLRCPGCQTEIPIPDAIARRITCPHCWEVCANPHYAPEQAARQRVRQVMTDKPNSPETNPLLRRDRDPHEYECESYSLLRFFGLPLFFIALGGVGLTAVFAVGMYLCLDGSPTLTQLALTAAAGGYLALLGTAVGIRQMKDNAVAQLIARVVFLSVAVVGVLSLLGIAAITLFTLIELLGSG